MIALLQVSPNVEHNRRGMDFAQWPGIRWQILRDDVCSKIAHPFQLAGKIDRRFPVCNLIRDFVANSFDLPKLTTFCSEDLLRLLKNLQQLAQPHGPNGGQHVECDTGFRCVHFLIAVILSEAKGISESFPESPRKY